MRQEESSRRKKRQEVKERKEKEKEKRRDEIKQLKALKRKEIMDKLNKLKKISGAEDLGLNEEDLVLALLQRFRSSLMRWHSKLECCLNWRFSGFPNSQSER
jgi:hypothetical protein